MQEFYLSQSWYWLVVGAIVSYFMGCFNFAILISKFKHDDIRHVGSGNPGAMNVSRRYGLKVGLVNFFCDGLKGAIPMLVAYLVFRNYRFAGTEIIVSDFMRYFYAIFALIGHVFPVTMKFKGGKGISTTIGLLWCAVACETWWFAFVGLALFILLFVYVGFTEWGSMGSLLGVAAFTIWQAVIFTLRYTENLSNVFIVLTFMFLLLLNIITWGAHHRNLYQLMAGEEHHTSLKKMLKKKKAK
ncbi:MAG: glycerol-3-phosphate acyltransferase [Clostridia bacterium]|nr:glycerol-3-phosphate acyltransferase [Clostridia bacterium]